MFKDVKLKDKLWSLQYGWGVCGKIFDDGFRVWYDNAEVFYGFDGREFEDDVNPTVFWGEIEFEAPEKPLNAKELILKYFKPIEFKIGDDNLVFFYNKDEDKYVFGKHVCNAVAGICYFNKLIEIDEKDFNKKIKKYNISSKEINKALSEIYGIFNMPVEI